MKNYKIQNIILAVLIAIMVIVCYLVIGRVRALSKYVNGYYLFKTGKNLEKEKADFKEEIYEEMDKKIEARVNEILQKGGANE